MTIPHATPMTTSSSPGSPPMLASTYCSPAMTSQKTEQACKPNQMKPRQRQRRHDLRFVKREGHNWP
jgi:hypothetical protein